jgi:hypothetical protein
MATSSPEGLRMVRVARRHGAKLSTGRTLVAGGPLAKTVLDQGRIGELRSAPRSLGPMSHSSASTGPDGQSIEMTSQQRPVAPADWRRALLDYYVTARPRRGGSSGNARRRLSALPQLREPARRCRGQAVMLVRFPVAMGILEAS